MLTIASRANPAGLKANHDTVHDMFNKIVTTGNAGNDVRFDQQREWIAY